jgi:hypothetical protein
MTCTVTGCGKSNLFCHSERSEESLLGLSLTKEREILRFAQNDKNVGRFFPQPLRFPDLDGRGNQAGDVNDQSSFRHCGEICELNAHAFINHGVPDNALKRDILVPRSQCEVQFRPNRERIRVEDKNSFHA